MSDFRKLRVYQKSLALARRVSTVLPRIRRKSRRLQDQLERSTESIPEAIAEGRGRGTEKDFAGFLTTAISSANEAEHQLQRALDAGALTELEHASLNEDLVEVRKMLYGLRRTVRGD